MHLHAHTYARAHTQTHTQIQFNVEVHRPHILTIILVFAIFEAAFYPNEVGGGWAEKPRVLCSRPGAENKLGR